MNRANPTRFASEGLPPEDWNLMFDAVVEKLQQCVCAAPAPAPATCATVEDCVRSLGLLRAALGQERGKLTFVEAQLRDTCAALATARVELRDAQASELHAQHLSQHDSLTELPNRSQFRRRLDDALGAWRWAGAADGAGRAVPGPGRLQVHQ